MLTFQGKLSRHYQFWITGISYDFKARDPEILNMYTLCRIRDGGGAGPIIFEGRSCPQQTIYHWKGNLSKS